MNENDFDSKFEEIVENNPEILAEQVFGRIYKKTFWWSLAAIFLLTFLVPPLAFILGVPLLLNLVVIIVVKIEGGVQNGVLYCLLQFLVAKFLTIAIGLLLLASIIL